MSEDELDDFACIFYNQRELQLQMGRDVTLQEYKNEMLYALVEEVVEAGRETAWKSWKKGEYKHDKFVSELSDIQLFLLNLVISSGIDEKQFLELVKKKQDDNARRFLKNGEKREKA